MTQQDSPLRGKHNTAKQNSTGNIMEGNNKVLLLSIMEDLNSSFMTLLLIYKIGAFYTCSNKTLQHQIPLYCTNCYRYRKQRKNKRLYTFMRATSQRFSRPCRAFGSHKHVTVSLLLPFQPGSCLNVPVFNVHFKTCCSLRKKFT